MKSHAWRISSRRLLGAAAAMAVLAGILLGWHMRWRQTQAAQGEGFIKWVDFNVTLEALELALELDIASHEGEGVAVSWIDLLAYTTAKNGNDFTRFSAKEMRDAAARLQAGTPLGELTAKLKLFAHYQQIYAAVLSGMAGYFREEVADEAAPGGKRWETRYGLLAYSPIAKGFPYDDYDDFGAGRSYGYRRRHLGHDMMGQVGTPVVAVEGGVVEALGWNQYGGWRIGIRSFDGKRYYYYAHLRRNYPYVKWLTQGCEVKAGDVIGYLGRTGYSATENTNNIDEPHLHFGIQLIFDESQKEGDGEIWVDVYPLVRLLQRHRSAAAKEPGGKEYYRVYGMELE